MTENNQKPFISQFYFVLALFLLCLGLFAGVLASIVYLLPEFLRESLGFHHLRPMHVSSVMFWIILGATGSVYACLNSIQAFDVKARRIAIFQLLLWIVALLGIYYSYISGDFGGREYWEFNPIWALPISLAWILFLFNFIRQARKISKWPVYLWMWLTGITFFLFIFLENYLWIFPYFRSDFISDMTVQWKVNGSIVGAINQLLYGVSFYLMDRITPLEHKKVGFSKLAFAMYFLGLTNLMFNWGHHIYTLPTESYIRYVSYIVSMSEWIIFLRIIDGWRKQMDEFQSLYGRLAYRFLIASEVWVFINLGQALLMSIPALNLYTHGTHVTVAHSMGTTIGINSMILLASLFSFIPNHRQKKREEKAISVSFWILQISLFCLFISLDIAGVLRGLWQLEVDQESFSMMMERSRPWYIILTFSGVGLALSFLIIASHLLKKLMITKKK